MNDVSHTDREQQPLCSRNLLYKQTALVAKVDAIIVDSTPVWPSDLTSIIASYAAHDELALLFHIGRDKECVLHTLSVIGERPSLDLESKSGTGAETGEEVYHQSHRSFRLTHPTFTEIYVSVGWNQRIWCIASRSTDQLLRIYSFTPPSSFGSASCKHSDATAIQMISESWTLAPVEQQPLALITMGCKPIHALMVGAHHWYIAVLEHEKTENRDGVEIVTNKLQLFLWCLDFETMKWSKTSPLPYQAEISEETTICAAPSSISVSTEKKKPVVNHQDYEIWFFQLHNVHVKITTTHIYSCKDGSWKTIQASPWYTSTSFSFYSREDQKIRSIAYDHMFITNTQTGQTLYTKVYPSIPVMRDSVCQATIWGKQVLILVQDYADYVYICYCDESLYVNNNGAVTKYTEPQSKFKKLYWLPLKADNDNNKHISISFM